MSEIEDTKKEVERILKFVLSMKKEMECMQSQISVLEMFIDEHEFLYEKNIEKFIDSQ